MRLRAVVVGLAGAAFAVFIATAGYYVGRVAGLNRFVFGQFPIIVYGPLVLVVLLVNPLLSLISRRLRLSPQGMCVIIVMGLAASSIPSNGLLRYFTRVVVMPIQLNEEKENLGWREAKVMEDVPPVMLANRKQYDEKLAGGFTRTLGDGKSLVPPHAVPWAKWTETLTFWGAVIFLFAMASICLVLIVHPQWSRRERLRYPIAVFADAMLETGEADRPRPIYKRRVFWVLALMMLGLHVVNGSNRWLEGRLIQIPLSFDFSLLLQKFKSIQYGWGLGNPTIWPTAVALAFFLAKDVTFSVGISQPLAGIVGAFLVHQGLMEAQSSWVEGGGFRWQRAGSCMALALVLLYLGRRFYWLVFKEAVSFRRAGERTERYSVWACRGLLVSLALLTFILVKWADLSWPLAIGFVLLTLLAYLAVARITAEFGIFYVQIEWLPVAVLFGLFGANALGPTGLVVLGLLSVVFVMQPEESLLPFVLMGLRIGEGRRLSGGKAGWGAAAAFALALAAAVPFALWIDYSFGGASPSGWDWDGRGAPGIAFDSLERAKSEMIRTGELEESRAMSGWQRIMNIRPSGAFLWATGLGFAAVLGTYFLRLRYTWWPIHPIMFLVWQTWASRHFFHSFFLAWVIQVILSRVGTRKVHRAAKDAMIGIIAGELMGGVLWMCVGAVYRFSTGVAPKYYSIFPY